MKFSFFHLMPYPYLPDDFDENYPSSALTFPNSFFDPKLGNQLYHRYLDELEYADRLGFDGIAVNEHHQTAYGLMPSPNIMAAALARRTERAKIMVLGNAIGIRGNPLRVAEEIAMLDHLSNGRVVSGFVRGIGWEYFGHSINPTRSRARFNEAHDLIIKAWTSPEMFQWISPNYEYRYVNLWPRPLQQPHPPVYIPGAGSTETMKFCAERRYTYMSVYAPVRVVRRWFDGYRQAAADLGYVPDPEKIAFSVPVYVADSDEQAHREAQPVLEWLFRKGLKQPGAMHTPPGYMSPSSLRGVLMSGMKPFYELSYEDLLAGGQAVVGSPGTVTRRLRELHAELGGFGQLNALFSIGPSTHEQVTRSSELFATEVIPELRTLDQDGSRLAGEPPCSPCARRRAVAGDVAILTVDRPAVGNAIGLATMDALDQAMDAFDQAVDAAADADVLVARGSGDPHHHPAHEESSAAFAILFVDLRRHRAAVAGGQPS